MRTRIHVSLLFALMAMLGSTAGRAQAPAGDTTSRERAEAARENWQRVPDIFAAMGLRHGAVVADVGAGGGFLTVRLAKAVGPHGRVIAVDVNVEVIERLRTRIQQEGLTNVEIVTGEAGDPHVTASSLDAAVIVNAYHEMREYRSMLHHLRRALKPDGRLVIVEPLSGERRNASRDEQTGKHEIAPAFVEQEAREAGFRILRLEDPFTADGAERLWLLVAVPDSRSSSEGAHRIPPQAFVDHIGPIAGHRANVLSGPWRRFHLERRSRSGAARPSHVHRG
jgi:precorrin-6B methylase 2